ncbi:Phospholipase ddhd1 [Homalodisca vitripennis]|nr:Phospholipase ddhd1 [Homalodisca vitripennis]
MDSAMRNTDRPKSSEDCNVSLINPDSQTTLYLEDDNNSFGVGDLPLEDNITSPKVENESKPIWPTDHLRDSDEIVDVLRPEQIRWFYKNIANKQWVEFNGYDSLRIEKRYKNLNEKEWRDYNATYRSKKNQDKSPNSSPTFESFKTNGNHAKSSTSAEECSSPSSETADRVVVRGGLYEVVVPKRNCTSIFWPGFGKKTSPV